MSADTWEKLLLLVAGGAIAALGAWLNEVRSEKRRKGTKLEEAYVGWLNAHELIFRRLRELADLADEEAVSAESNGLLVEKLDRVNADLQSLQAALNIAFVYERDRTKKDLVEKLLAGYEVIVGLLTQLVSRHKVQWQLQQAQVGFHSRLSRADAMVLHVRKLKEAKGVESNAQLAEEAAKVERHVRRYRNKIARDAAETAKLASSSAVRLTSRARKLFEDLKEMDETMLPLRRILLG
jgi:hypothetical protein